MPGLTPDGKFHNLLAFHDGRPGAVYPIPRPRQTIIDQLLATLDLTTRGGGLSAQGRELLALIDAMRDNPERVLTAIRREVRLDATDTPGGRTGSGGRPPSVPDGDAGTPAPAAA